MKPYTYLGFGSVVLSSVLLSTSCQKPEQSPVYSEATELYQPINQSLEEKVSSGDSTDTPTQSPEVFERRWVGGHADSPKGDLLSIINKFNKEKFTDFKLSDFFLTEERLLATSMYRRYGQFREGIAVRGSSIRVWTHPESNKTIQIEARLSKYPESKDISQILSYHKQAKPTHIKNVISLVSKHPWDNKIKDFHSELIWKGNNLIDEITVQTEFGLHKSDMNLFSSSLSNHRYQAHIQSESGHRIPARVYPIWEPVHASQDPVLVLKAVDLDYLHSRLPDGNQNSFSVINSLNLITSNYDRALGNTIVGRSQGLWNNELIQSYIRGVLDTLPWKSNSFEESDQVRLVGKYARIFIHPEAAKLKTLQFSPEPSPYYVSDYNYWDQDAKISAGVHHFGAPLENRLSAYDRFPASVAESQNDLVELINSGFDEIQNYWAINVLFEDLHKMGFTDPELSTRAFDAILFNPSINMRDNAFYYNDTINFTNYSPQGQNLARDNTTIWHEIGHGLQDRLMGDHYRFQDSGGLNEGMADVLAHLVVQSQTRGKPFEGRENMRINNQIGFHLTNESHDDGEAYGGAMRDILNLAVDTFGFDDGLFRTSELIFETMRLTRDHPGITAEIWFEHMIFADSLKRDLVLPSGVVRQAGEMRSIVMDSLRSRNFVFMEEGEAATFQVSWGDDQILNSWGLASRSEPIDLALADNESQDYTLKIEVQDGTEHKFKYPVTIELSYEGGPLQGAVKWLGQDQKPVRLPVAQSGGVVESKITVLPSCDYVNRSDNSCSDFVYIKLYENGNKEAIGKKRFYVRIVAE